MQQQNSKDFLATLTKKELTEIRQYWQFEEEKKHLQPLPKNNRDGSVGEQTVVKGEKVGRNDPCPCGSGKKYKKCCLGKEN